MKHGTVAVITVVLLTAVTPVCAEVSDKVVQPQRMWLGALIGLSVGLFFGLRFRRLRFLAIPFGLAVPLQGVATIHDTYVGPAILKEAGIAYVIHAYGSAALAVVAGAIGAWWVGRMHTRNAAVQHGR